MLCCCRIISATEDEMETIVRIKNGIDLYLWEFPFCAAELMAHFWNNDVFPLVWSLVNMYLLFVLYPFDRFQRTGYWWMRRDFTVLGHLAMYARDVFYAQHVSFVTRISFVVHIVFFMIRLALQFFLSTYWFLFFFIYGMQYLTIADSDSDNESPREGELHPPETNVDLLSVWQQIQFTTSADCCICQGEVDAKYLAQGFVQLKCKHTYHTHCFVSYLLSSRTPLCALCRQKL